MKYTTLENNHLYIQYVGEQAHSLNSHVTLTYIHTVEPPRYGHLRYGHLPQLGMLISPFYADVAESTVVVTYLT